MNAFSGDDFGDVASLLRAIGLVGTDGEFENDWIGAPGDYLKDILANQEQRQALMEFIATLRGAAPDQDADGRNWIEIFADTIEAGTRLGFYFVMDESPASEIHLSLGVRLETSDPLAESTSSLLVPLFRTRKGAGAGPSSPELLGHPGGRFVLTSQITVATTPPPAGEGGLQAVGLSISIPTAQGDGDPQIGLNLRGLRLPGETTSRDLVLSLTDPAGLQAAGTELILGLLQAQLGGAAAGPVRALARLLGLGNDAQIPAFPIAGLLENGAAALADWLADLLGQAQSRTAWLNALAGLLANGASSDAESVRLPIGGASVRIGLRATPSPSGRPVVTVSLGFGFTDGGTEAAITADLLRLDLGRNEATAIPDLRATLQLDLSGLTMPDISVASFHFGLALNEARQPVLVLELRDVTVLSTHHDRLDLTNPDAMAAATAQIATDALGDLLGNLGPAGDLIAVALGWEAPAGASASYPRIDLVAFLGDPLGRLKAHWLDVLDNHSSDVDAALGTLRQMITGTAGGITGLGTEVEPWALPLVAGLNLSVWRDAGGRLVIGMSFLRSVDTLGERCTVIETRLRLGIIAINLASGAVEFLPGLRVSLLGRARGGGPLIVGGGGLILQADHLGLTGHWAPNTPLTIGCSAPNPLIFIDDLPIPLDIPDFSHGFTGVLETLTAAQWRSIEQLVALLAQQAEQPWMRDLIDALGWLPRNPVLGEPDPFRLPLADLVSDAEAALRHWLAGLIEAGATGLGRTLEPLAKLLAGAPNASFSLSGRGTLADPYRVGLTGTPNLPQLAAWLEPDLPLPRAAAMASQALRRWQPGQDGLDASELARAVFSEFPDFDGLVAPRLTPDLLTGGLRAVRTLLASSDGFCLPPATAIPGAVTHIVEGLTAQALFAAHDVAPFLGGAAPDTIILVSTLAQGASVPPLGVAADHQIDLREPGRDPLTFDPIPNTAGIWQILLAPRADARLPSGDADGTRGQAARLKQALSLIGARPGAVVVALGGAGHAAWLALNEPGAALNRLIAIGTPVGAAQIQSATPATQEILSRLAELLPQPDPANPDDADLAAARALLAARVGPHAQAAAELAIPAGWTGAVRAGLALHLVHGISAASALDRALTAAIAAGLSLRAQTRAAQRLARRITGAGFGLCLPFDSNPATGQLDLKGQVLAELVGSDIDMTGGAPAARLRTSRRVIGYLELRRRDGWLIGGPSTGPRPAVELRAMSIEAMFTYGPAPHPPGDRLRIDLHGVHIHGQSFPRISLSADPATGALQIDGLAPATMPEIQQMLSRIMAEIASAATGPLRDLAELLRAAGILGAGDSFDALTLARWCDNAKGRLQDLLANPALAARLFAAINTALNARAGVSFDLSRKEISVTLSGSTNEPVLQEWALTATLSPLGLVAGALRLGPVSGLHLQLGLVPLRATLRLNGGAPQGLGVLPAEIALWPTPDIALASRLLPPALIATALSRALEGVRQSDPTARPIIDAALTAFGLLRGAPGTARVAIPAVVFSDPRAWLLSDTVLGQDSGGNLVLRADRVIAALDGLKPLVGVPGGPGVWELAAGIALRARNDAGGTTLEIALDASAFQPSAEVAFGGAFGLHFPASGTVRPALAIFAGLRGGTPGQRAVHLTVNNAQVRLFLRPSGGSDLEIFPNMAGFGQLAAAGVTAALPAVLDAIVATNSDVGRFVGDLGDALLLRAGGHFDADVISDWATDPAGTLQAQWPALLGSGLARLNPLLPNGVSLSNPGGGVMLSLSNVATPGSTLSLTLQPVPFKITLAGDFTAIPFIGAANASLAFDATGLARLTAGLGPAAITLDGGITLRPVFTIDVGHEAAPARIATGLAMDTGATRALLIRYDFDTQVFDLGFGTNTPEEIAAGLMALSIDLLGGFVMGLQPVQDVMAIEVGNTGSIQSVLTNVMLTPGGALDSEFFRVIPNPGETVTQFFDSKLNRLIRLAQNLAAANPTISIDGKVDISLVNNAGVIGITLGLSDRLELVPGDITIWLENDSRWIISTPPAGLEIGFLDLSGPPAFKPSFAVNGVGLRIGRQNAPLIASPLALGSIALHGYGRVSETEILGGVQVQLAEIGAAVGGAGGDGGGGNAVAQGMLAETSDGEAALAPAFSPAFSIQTKPAAQGGGIAFGFRAGDGDGPWWLPIRSQFGPLYIDQVGLGTQIQNDSLQSISLLFDGNVSIAGLQAAVDDLELRYRLDRGGIFDPNSWSVDLAGLAVSADLSGVTLAGGLRKFGAEPNVEYIGMLTARFAVYGLSIYGGYASIQTPSRFTAFFAFGAVVGPFGGPPAFFLTGIGGGFGINRDIVPPTDMSRFNEFPMLAALDPSFDPPDDMMAYMAEVRAIFPAVKDRFWFAAGISFTSFSLVDGIAVVAVEFGQGFELSIFGLARLALPRPAVAIVSIELGLMARFSTEEGVLWIQAQLTDNSWLFHPSARLTGGFAFVSWFKGPNAGQFVLTLGGYHPNFRADGYPNVPRLGLNWAISSFISIKAETYFALTSEAVMAGGLFEVDARFGPAYAHLSFGGNAIVYFDPFRYEADAHARVSCGIRIETFLGDIDLGFTLGVEVQVAGPKFHGRARIEIGPIDITVPFGDSQNVPAALLSWPDFVGKYLELAAGNKARAMGMVAGRGALPPASASGTESGTAPDGSAAHPFDVQGDFELSLTSALPITRLSRPDMGNSNYAPSHVLGLAPMGRVLNTSTLTLSLRLDGSTAEHLVGPQIGVQARNTGAFPMGVWGPTPSMDDKKIPKGKVIRAVEGVDLKFFSRLNNRIPEPTTGGIAFNQVEAGPRKPLPLRTIGATRMNLSKEAAAQRKLIAGMDRNTMPQLAQSWAQKTAPEPLERRAWWRERVAPMRIGLLSERILGNTVAGKKKTERKKQGKGSVQTFGTSTLRGVMMQPLRDQARGGLKSVTTVSKAEGIARMRPLVLAEITSGKAIEMSGTLLRADTARPVLKNTLSARSQQPITLSARGMGQIAQGRAVAGDRATLAGLSAMLLTGGKQAGRRRASRRLAADDTRAMQPGEIAVLDFPGAAAAPRLENSGNLTLKGRARLIAVGLDGQVLLNQYPAQSQTELPAHTSYVTLVAGGESDGEFSGWTEGTQLAYLGRSLARCRGGLITAEGAGRKGAPMGWMAAGQLTDQSSLVQTRFDDAARTVAILLDGDIGPQDMADLSIGFDRAEAGEMPVLVPCDGKTIVAWSVTASEPGFAITIAGLVPGRLDGVIATRMSPDRLIARIVNETVWLDMESLAGSGPVTAQWRAPADIKLAEGE